MQPKERVLTEDETYLVAVVLFDLLDLRIHQTARRALVVAELFEHDGRTVAAERVRGLRAGQSRSDRAGLVRAVQIPRAHGDGG